VDADFETSRGERQRTRRLFNRTARCYWVIHRALLPRYRATLARLGLSPALTVLDVGTGTGALAQAFAERGHAVTGIDLAERLLARARRRVPRARFEHLDLVHLPRLADASFDVVALAFVLHGLPPELRRFALAEARRIASRHVLVVDYARRGSWPVRLVERLEGPHYPSFVAAPVPDLLLAAGLVVEQELPTAPFSACWLCAPGNGEGRS